MEAITWEDRDGLRWIQLEGEIDHQAVVELRLKDRLGAAVADGDWDVVVVMEGVTFLCSAAIGLLLATSAALRKKDRALKLSGLPANLARLLTEMDILKEFEEI
jgi:anti-anti-sigma factor